MDESGTLDELDPPAWDPAEQRDSPMVKRCLALRATPLAEWDLDDLRLMVGQQIALPILMPRAIEILLVNPFVEAGNYRGDLLHMFLTVDGSYWHEYPDQWSEVDSIVHDFMSVYEDISREVENFRHGIWR